MEKKSVLILGASIMQKNAILSAKNLGYNTVVVDSNPNAPFVNLADTFFPIDLKDKDGIFDLSEKLFKNENLKGIFTAGTDFSSSVSYAGEKLGFSVHSYEAALNASIKPRMRMCFSDFGVPSPDFSSFAFDDKYKENKADFFDEVSLFVSKIGYPCVVKPADNMGARGCRMIRGLDEIYPAVLNAVENSRSKTVIIEKYMKGPEFSIDAIVYDGTLTITGFADRHIFYEPYFIETGHTMPSLIDDEKKSKLISVFAQGVKALGLSCGAAKADIKWTENGPQIGEIAARLSGGFMSGWTFPYSSDFNLIEQALLIATGQKPENLLAKRKPIEYCTANNCSISEKPFDLFEIPSVRFSAERAWISIPGTVQKISGCDKVPYVKDIFEKQLEKETLVDFPRNNVQKLGNVISIASSFQEATLCAQKACSNVFVRLKPNDLQTEKFLCKNELPDEKGFPPSAFSCESFIESINLDGFIKENESVLKNIPPALYELLNNEQKDWNYLTAMETALKFDENFPVHPELNKKRFWSALFRGGYQAAVYVMDCASDNKNQR